MSKIDSKLSFSLLARAPSKKVMQTFQKEAGLSPVLKMKFENSFNPNCKTQWVGVNLDNAMVGIARLELAPPEFCFISNFIVKSQYRRHGIGKWLLGEIEKYCSGIGIRRLLLKPTDESLPFYETLFFTPDPLISGYLKKEIAFFATKKQFIGV